MIGIGRTTKGSIKAIAYASREEKGEQKAFATEISRNGIVGENARAIYQELMAVAHQNHRVDKPFYNVVLSPSAENTLKWSLEDWEKLVNDFLEKKALSSNQHIAYLHQDTDTSHLHLIVNRIDFNGENRVNQRFIGKQTSAVANELAQERGWKNMLELSKEKSELKVLQYGNVLVNGLKESSNLEDLTVHLKDLGYGLNLQFDQNERLKGLKIFQFSEILENEKRKQNRQKPVNYGVKFSELSRSHEAFKKLKAGHIQTFLEQKKEKEMLQQEQEIKPKRNLGRRF
ncbi:relaxase/mobilization nuclease domain-containing protein [Empedobacter falsenii]|uniref:relaxase/mobilization nuclease domain-containing protein n=1 Tax=Empedobacter TaxID=59734 RepID=UPI000EB9B414|nr:MULTISPECIES: relaxase/mobilization nuclease domain-containing protein [unclassified Empedobacter]HCC95686.1 hypothetical protein [Flavobacteriaceae bacterium]